MLANLRMQINSIKLCRSGDFLRTISDAKDDMQLFWEAFPAEGVFHSNLGFILAQKLLGIGAA